MMNLLISTLLNYYKICCRCALSFLFQLAPLCYTTLRYVKLFIINKHRKKVICVSWVWLFWVQLKFAYRIRPFINTCSIALNSVQQVALSTPRHGACATYSWFQFFIKRWSCTCEKNQTPVNAKFFLNILHIFNQ